MRSGGFMPVITYWTLDKLRSLRARARGRARARPRYDQSVFCAILVNIMTIRMSKSLARR
jgi:hypothetical protein